MRTIGSGVCCVPSNLGTPGISKQTVSGWIRQLIKQAYSEVQDEDIPHLTHTNFQARELRAFASSLAFHQNYSLKQVMEAASWRNNNMFVSFYLRDLSQMGDVTTTGPFMAGQQVISWRPCNGIRATSRCWLPSHSFHCPEPGTQWGMGPIY